MPLLSRQQKAICSLTSLISGVACVPFALHFGWVVAVVWLLAALSAILNSLVLFQ